MNLVDQITVIIDISLLSIAAVISSIYILPIIFIQRFHTTINILTVNVGIGSIICAVFWIILNVVLNFYPFLFYGSISSCICLTYFTVFVNVLLIYSFVVITINRYLTIIYSTKPFFKRRTWVFLSIVVHWFVCFLISIPNLVKSIQECVWRIDSSYGFQVYIFIIMVIIPSILMIVFNLFIYKFVRSSTRRIQATTENVNQANSRDIYLLKHMLFIFIVFIIGWTPTYINSILDAFIGNISWKNQIFEIMAVASSMIIVLDLFFYNYDLRRYLSEKILKILKFI